MSIIKVNHLVLSLVIIVIQIETANGQNYTMTHLKNPTETCQQAVSGVKEYLIKNKYFISWKQSGQQSYPKVLISQDHIAKYYFDYPEDRKNSLLFGLSGDWNRIWQGFLLSLQLQTNLSARIMTACPDIGLVYFGHPYEDGRAIFFFPDGTARAFIGECSSEENPEKEKWGYDGSGCPY